VIAIDYRTAEGLGWITWVTDKRTASRAVAVLLRQGAEVIVRQPKDDRRFWELAYPDFS
jgi:hypothetical protein